MNKKTIIRSVFLSVCLFMLTYSTVFAHSIVATRGQSPNSYTVTADRVVSPQFHARYHGRGVWLFEGADLTIRADDEQDFYLQWFDPEINRTDYHIVSGFESIVLEQPGQWTFDFGRTGIGFYRMSVTIVNTPQEAINLLYESELMFLISKGVLTERQGIKLSKKLFSAIEKLDNGNERAAYAKLSSFIYKVQKYIDRGVLLPIDEQGLIDPVKNIGSSCIRVGTFISP